MGLKIRKFAGMEALQSYLDGVLEGGIQVFKGSPSLYLHGKTLIFAAPSGTVTFAASPANANVALTPAQVLTQIETQLATVSAAWVKGLLQLKAATPGTITLDKDGTANALLGFGSSADMTATPVSAPGDSAPSFVAFGSSANTDNSILVVIDEG